jgi:hypothetical protein
MVWGNDGGAAEMATFFFFFFASLVGSSGLFLFLTGDSAMTEAVVRIVMGLFLLLKPKAMLSAVLLTDATAAKF